MYPINTFSFYKQKRIYLHIMEITQKVVSGRRLTIPKAVAKAMDIEVGDIITVSIKGVARGKNRERGK